MPLDSSVEVAYSRGEFIEAVDAAAANVLLTGS